MMAQDLKHSLTKNWRDWSIDVPYAEGQMFLDIPITTAGFAAALWAYSKSLGQL
jgi:hypothetical protein